MDSRPVCSNTLITYSLSISRSVQGTGEQSAFVGIGSGVDRSRNTEQILSAFWRWALLIRCDASLAVSVLPRVSTGYLDRIVGKSYYIKASTIDITASPTVYM